MDPKILKTLKKSSNLQSLLEPTLDSERVEIEVENVLRHLVKELREDKNLSTRWDHKLAHILTPALMNYEMDRLGGVTFGEEEFQESIKQHIPQGHTFKAFPI